MDQAAKEKMEKQKTTGVIVTNSTDVIFKGVEIKGYDVGLDATNVEGLKGEDVKITGASKKNNDNPSSNRRRWYKHPIVIGLIVTIVGGVILWVILISVQHFFPDLRLKG